MNPEMTTQTATGDAGNAGANGASPPGGADVGIWDKIKGFLPDTSDLYLEPLDPSSRFSSIADRASLVVHSARPWSEFFDLRAFNLPPFSQVTERLGHNVKTYFYNYFLLTCVHLLLFAIGHFWSFVTVGLWIAMAIYLLVLRPEDFEVGPVPFTKNRKTVYLVVAGVLAVIFGHALTLVISLGVFLLIVVGIHGTIRDNTLDDVGPNV